MEATNYYDPPNLTFPFGTYICVVDIDRGTGEVSVRRFVAVDDCGNIINPMIVQGQIHGGLTQGLGPALYEEMTYDEDGNNQAGSFMDYLVPTAVETPAWETGHTITPSPHHPLGAKGVGESATVGAPPAIVNAVVDALAHLGVTHMEIPMRPDRVWEILREKGVAGWRAGGRSERGARRDCDLVGGGGGVRGGRYGPNPFPYQGSKRRLAPQILQYLPRSVPRLVEPFAGSAAVSIAVAMREGASRYWINDAHEPLVALWRELLNRPEDLASRYAFLWRDQDGRERQYYDEVRDRFNGRHDPADFLYLLARCVKAAVRYNANGDFNNTPDNRRRGARPSEMRRRLIRVSTLLKDRTRVTSWDYRKVLRDCTSSDIVYMDPPYQGVCGSRDQRYLPRVDHDRLCADLAELTSRKVMFAVSYDGRTGAKRFGANLPESLGLVRLEVRAGRSTQATLLGRDDITYESLYLSPTLAGLVTDAGTSRAVCQPGFL